MTRGNERIGSISVHVNTHTFFVLIFLFFRTILRRTTPGNPRVATRLLFRSYVNTDTCFHASWGNSTGPRVGITCANMQSSLFVEYCSRRFCSLAFFFVLCCEYSGLLHETKNTRGIAIFLNNSRYFFVFLTYMNTFVFKNITYNIVAGSHHTRGLNT